MKGVLVECSRCGNEQHEPRAGRFPDEEYLETFHELMDAQAEIKRLRRALLHEQQEAQFWREQAEWWGREAVWICEQWLGPLQAEEDYNPFP